MATLPMFATAPAPSQLRCFNPTCGHVWFQRTPRPPLRCPRCQSRHWYNPSYPFKSRQRPRLRETAPEPPPPPTPETA